MEVKRVLVMVMVLSVWCLSSFLGAQARHLNLERPQATELKEVADWLRREAKHTGEERVDEIVAAAEKWKKVSGLPRAVQEPARGHLDEIDRLKLSINKILCESMEEGCDHMGDMGDSSAEGSAETFANLDPEEFVKVDA